MGEPRACASHRDSSQTCVCHWKKISQTSHLSLSLQVFWSDSGELVCIASEGSYYVLQYKPEAVAEALSTNQGIDEDGIEAAFEVIGEIEETVKTGLWVGDCFIYTNSVNRLNYYVGGEIVTISHLDRSVFIENFHTGQSSHLLC